MLMRAIKQNKDSSINYCSDANTMCLNAHYMCRTGWAQQLLGGYAFFAFLRESKRERERERERGRERKRERERGGRKRE